MRALVASGVKCPVIKGARKAIRRPSGNHRGSDTPSGRSVTFSASPPSKGRMWSCGFSALSFLRTKATRVPSGETRGAELEASPEVSGRGSNAPVVETIHRRVRPSFFSRSKVVTGTTAQVPSFAGAGEPTRGMVHRSLASSGRPAGRRAG